MLTMGGTPKKVAMLRALWLCLAVFFSLLAVTATSNLLGTVAREERGGTLEPSNNVYEDPDLYTEWINLVSGEEYGFSNHPFGTKTIYIMDEGELANLNRALTMNVNDYSGYTFILASDLDMSKKYPSSESKEPVPAVWTPINTTPGTNTGIIFDGNGKKISNLLMIMNDDETVTDGVRANNGFGFFGNLTGCTVRNVTFENPVIKYTYVGDSKTSTDPERPTAPVPVGIGVVAGIAENAYVNKVNIVNPQITVTTNNANGHSLYVGGVVGKMVYDAYDATPLLQSVTNPDDPTDVEHRWGVDTVTVTAGEGTKFDVTVTPGSETYNQTYGMATFGYIGGVVGYNNSAKVINSKVQGLNINPQIPENAFGNYYVGGLAGFSMLRVKTLNDVVLAGVINNVIIDSTVTSGNVNTDSIARTVYSVHSGALVGQIYDSWVYNNIAINDDKSLPLYGSFWNRKYNIFYDSCLGYFDYERLLGSDYFLIGEETVLAGETVTTLDFSRCKPQLYGYYWVCRHHTVKDDKVIFPYLSDNSENENFELYANQYNFQMTKQEFATFKNGAVFGKFADFENKDGNFFEIGKQRVLYEAPYRGTAEPGKGDYNDQTRIRKAVNELRVWKVDENGEPGFGDNLGYDYDVVFHANGENMKHDFGDAGRANAGWVQKGEYEYMDTILTQKIKKYKYKEKIESLTGQEMPTCEGWKFDGWYADADCQDRDESEQFNFATAEMKGSTINLYAKWVVKTYDVEYYLDENDAEPYRVDHGVVYGSYIMKPADPELPATEQFLGKSFAGYWYYLEAYYEYDENGNPVGEPEYREAGEWVFDNVENYSPMPGQVLKLYAGIQDDFVILREVMESTEVQFALTHQDCYTADSFKIFQTAYDNGRAVMEASSNLPDDQTVSQVVATIRDTLAALVVNIEAFKALPPFDENVDQNRYPFLYQDYDAASPDFHPYRDYTDAKRAALNYLNVEIANPDMLHNVERYLYIRDTLLSKYNNLAFNPNPNLGMNTELVNAVKQGYTQIMQTIDDINPDDYTKQSWDNVNFNLVIDDFKKTFKSDYQNPYIADMKKAIDNYHAAKAQLVRNQGNTDVPNATVGKKSGVASQIIIGVMVFLLAIGGVSGYIGFDLYMNKKVKPKKEQAEKAERAAADDTYI